MAHHAPYSCVAIVVLAAGCGGAHPASSSAPATTPASTVQVEAVSPTPSLDEPAAEPAPSEPALATISVDPSGLQLEDLVVGQGAEAIDGSEVRVHYIGTLLDGTVFDESRKRAVPFAFKLGSRVVIPGFEQGVTGMRVGGVRRVTIPPELGYGEQGRPPVIPPSSVLVFELELIDVR